MCLGMYISLPLYPRFYISKHFPPFVSFFLLPIRLHDHDGKRNHRYNAGEKTYAFCLLNRTIEKISVYTWNLTSNNTGGHLAFRAAFDTRLAAAVCYFATDIHSHSLGAGKDDDSLQRAGEIRGEVIMVSFVFFPSSSLVLL